MSRMAYAEQRGNCVYVFSVGGSLIWVKNGRLISFNGNTVVIEYCSKVCVYDENGNEVK